MTKPQKYRDVIRFLRSRGWKLTRTRGSHQIWQSPDGGESIAIATHGGTVSVGIIRQLQAAFNDTPSNWN